MSAAVLVAPPAPVLAALLLAGAAAAWVAWVAARYALGVARHRRLPLPSPPETHPVLGHALGLLSDTSPLLMAKWVRECGPMFKLRVLGQSMVILTDPAAIAKVNRLPGTTKPDLYRKFDLPSVKTASMFSDPGTAYWKAIRVGVAPCFSMTSLKRTFPWLLHLCNMAVAEVGDAAREGRSVDVACLAGRVTSDTIGDMLLSKDLGGMARRGGTPTDGPDYISLVRGYLSATHAALNDPLQHWKRFTEAGRVHAASNAAWDEAIKACTQDVMANPPPEYTIAGHLLRVIDPTTGRPLTLEKLKSELSTLYMAGFETTSHAITWSLGLLAAHPTAQQTLAAELAAAGLAPPAGGGEARPFAWGDLGRLPYLMAVIKESMRLFQPAAGGSLRALPCDTEVRGLKLPKGTFITQPFYALGRSKALYGDDADEFRPERWLLAAKKGAGGDGGGSGGSDGERDTDAAPDAGSRARSAALPADPLPFSVGPRDCVGQSLAMLELQAVLATLVGRFSWSLPPELAALGTGTIAPLQQLVCYHITLHPRNGLSLVAAPRGGGTTEAAPDAAR